MKKDVKGDLNGIVANMLFLKSYLDFTIEGLEKAYNDMYAAVALAYMTVYCVEDFLEIEETGHLTTSYSPIDYQAEVHAII